jgi:V/A-type H+-transporting ATPase subunit E
MEIKLENLIAKLKQEGVEAAQKEAAEILQKANAEANAIVAKAKEDAQQIIAAAQQESQKLQRNAEAAIRQAARDTILVTKENLSKLFARAFTTAIARQLQPAFLMELIRKVVESNFGAQLEFSVSPADLEQLKQLLLQETYASIRDVVVLKPERSITAGFRVRRVDENLYYDLDNESIAAFLQEFLNPAIRQILEQNG